MIRSAAESGESVEYLGLLADWVAQTHGPDMTVSQLGRQHHERRAAAGWPYRLRAGRMAACCLSAERVGNNIKSEVQGLHTEALQCAGYCRSHAFTLRDYFAAPRRGIPLSACPVARSEPTAGGRCRAWAPTGQ